MNATVLAPAVKPPSPAQRTWADFRLIPRIETYPRVVSFAQTMPGQLLLLALFGIGLRWFVPDVLSVLGFVLVAGLATFLPDRRRFILAIAPIVILLVQAGASPMVTGISLAVIALGVLLFVCARRWPKSTFGQRPIIFLLSGFSALILLATAATPHTFAYRLTWELVGVASTYVWFIGYALTDRVAKPAEDTSLELTAFRPLWGSTTTPFPKGAAYLRRIEAKNSEQLAIVQLKGLKLLIWAILLSLAYTAWMKLFHSYLGIPTSVEALTMSVQRMPLPWRVRWESQILAFFESIFTISILGHRIIACCRLSGFNALRNTYRPLSATTVAEFFNRYYYYFKELLVDFFFYPAFLRYWKGHRRLRFVFATFSAILFGDTFFHFTRDWWIIRDSGLRQAIVGYEVILFYCLLLATALSFSQLRTRGPKPGGFFRGRLVPALSVAFFYCVLDTFGTRTYSLAEHMRYLASLFFIRF